MDASPLDSSRWKQAIREQALARRGQQPAAEELSRIICAKVAELEAYRRASVVMSYVGVRSEVRTQSLLAQVIQADKTLVVPYCLGSQLGLYRLEHLDELSAGIFGLLEPSPRLRERPEKQVEAARLDLVLVPGLAFDRQGGRLGHGKGYYDRLLNRVRPDALLVGLAFECQIFPAVPMQAHDVFMDLVITEQGIEEGTGPRPRPGSA